MLNKFVASCLLSLAALPAFAADEFRVEYRLDMSEAQFRQANEKYFNEGLRLADITVSEVKGKPVIGAIWHRFGKNLPAPTPEQTRVQLANVFLKLDQRQLLETTKRLGDAGSAPEVVDAYQVGGKTWFAAAFSPPKGSVLQVVAGMLNADEVDATRESANKRDDDLMRMDAYADSGQVWLVPTLVHRGAADIDYDAFESTMDLLAYGAKQIFNGMQPLAVSVFELDGKTRFLGVWNEGAPADFVLTDNGEEIAKKVAGGGIIFDIDSHPNDIGGVSWYAVVQAKP